MIGRIFRLVRTPITLLLLLGVLAYGAWWGYRNVIQQIPAAPPEPCVTQTLKDGLKSSQVTVKVYNGGDRKGLAADVSRALRAKNFRVSGSSNTNEKIQKTVVVGADAKSPEVMMVASFFKDVEIRADGRVDHTVDVLVGNKYAGLDKKAKTTFPVRGKTVCLPATPKPTPATSAAKN